MKRACTTSILSQNNKACNGTNKSVKIVISLHCVIPFFSMSNANNRRRLKCTKYAFTAQKSYCACRVLSLATIRSKYYFNFILNRTRPGRELFHRPSYMLSRAKNTTMGWIQNSDDLIPSSATYVQNASRTQRNIYKLRTNIE